MPQLILFLLFYENCPGKGFHPESFESTDINTESKECNENIRNDHKVTRKHLTFKFPSFYTHGNKMLPVNTNKSV